VGSSVLGALRPLPDPPGGAHGPGGQSGTGPVVPRL